LGDEPHGRVKNLLRIKIFTADKRTPQHHNKMKSMNPKWKMSACLAAAALTFLSHPSAYGATAPALEGSLTQRPLTMTEINKYGFTNPEQVFSGGLSTVGLGEPVYVDAMVNASIAPSNITSVTWSLVTPSGSLATLLPPFMGTNVPLYNTADRISGINMTPVYQLAGTNGRAFFRPDAVGSYTVNATITTVGSGSTNLSISFNAATYIGLQDCAVCHSGALAAAPNIYSTYTNTPHSTFFTLAINGLESSHYNGSCIQCHVVGYDTNTWAVNGGFDDVAKEYGWSFPATLTTNNWAAMPQPVQNLANIQCENCHGPGSQHLSTFGDTNTITVNYNAGDCSQCHDDLNTHYYSAEWNNSLHSRSARETSPQCVRCHTGIGFIGWATAGGMAAQNLYPTNVIAANYFTTNILTQAPNTTYSAINCQACHDPHDASNPHQLRLSYNVVLSDGTSVTNAGAGGLCMQCHNSRNGSLTNELVQYPLNLPNWAGGSSFGTHDSPQGDMLEGKNAVTYGVAIPSSPHANVVSNTCVGCHMQTIASTDPAFTLAGGHTFKMYYTNSAGAFTPVTYVCAQCHGNISTFNFPVADYDGDGVIEGVQTEVQNLLNKLSTLLPPKVYQSNPANYMADGLVKTSVSTYTNMPTKFLQAAYNWTFVQEDGSLGIHNMAYTVGLLKASIANLTGVSSTGGLPDAWVLEYFGSLTNAAAAPTAINNAAGIPNWMMYALGLAPNAGFTVGNSGVVYFNGSSIVNGATNTIAIYKAAEIAFNTQVGTTYTIQGIDALSGSWQNVSTNIVGTGNSVSYLTPERQNVQMFYRVVHTP
jgi:nitrate reductase cytochrome c-type subunit